MLFSKMAPTTSTFLPTILPIIIFFTISITSPSVASQRADLTKVFGDKSEGLNIAVDEIIRSWCILPDFRYLINYIPEFRHHLSNGNEDQTLQSPLYKGLWKIDKSQFDYVKKELSGDLLEKFDEKLPKKWASVKWEDTEIPIIGGAVAALVLYYRSDKQPHIPTTSFILVDFFETYYRDNSLESSIWSFLGEVEDPEGKLDLLFMLDGTARLEANDFVGVLRGVAYAVSRLISRASNKNFDIKVAVSQYTNVVKSEIAFTASDLQEKIRAIKQLKTAVEGDEEKAIRDISTTFGTGRKVEEGVARVAVLVTSGFDQKDVESLQKVKQELRKGFINLIVIPAGRRTRAEYERIGALEDRSCPGTYLKEGLNQNHELEGYLERKIAEHTSFWVPRSETVLISDTPLKYGLKCKIEVGEKGATVLVGLQKLSDKAVLPADLKAHFYTSPDEISASPVYYDTHISVGLDQRSMIFAGYNEYAAKVGGANCFLKLSKEMENFKVTIISTPGRECNTFPCKNGAKCASLAAGTYECKCTAGYKGKDCEIKIDGCVNNPCKNNGKCVAGSDLKSYTCQCPEKFSGSNCETVKEVIKKPVPKENPCCSSPCLSTQDCVALDSSSHKCQCKVGFTGKNCDVKMTSCKEITCLNSGTCVEEDGKVACKCATNFSGNDCSIKGGASKIAPPLLLSITMALIVMIMM